VLLNFEHELRVLAVNVVFNLQRFVDRGQLARRAEVHVNDGADDLDDGSCIAHCDGD
jgi:hypothetical protein